jgi:hypothetical protein
MLLQGERARPPRVESTYMERVLTVLVVARAVRPTGPGLAKAGCQTVCHVATAQVSGLDGAVHRPAGILRVMILATDEKAVRRIVTAPQATHTRAHSAKQRSLWATQDSNARRVLLLEKSLVPLQPRPVGTRAIDCIIRSSMGPLT